MTITTATGKTYRCDLAVENPSPPRLYIHIINTPLRDVAAVFLNPEELPLEGYPAYTGFSGLSLSPSNGVNITLKKEEN